MKPHASAWWAVRILLDECLPRKLSRELTGHEVETVAQAGWSGVKNGELLRRAVGRYEASLTVDRKFAVGQSMPPLFLITLVAKDNRLETLKPLVPAVLQALAGALRGQRIRVGG